MKLAKTIIYILIFGVSVLGYSTELSYKDIFEKANLQFEEKNYKAAISNYELMVDSGLVSENLFYNLGNAYYKNDDIGKSIVFFEKTLKINPENKDAFHNLRLANSLTEDKLEILPDLFFVVWWKRLINYFSANTWAWLAIVFSWFALLAFAVYLFSKNMLFKKSGFFKAFIFGFISVLSLIMSGISSELFFKKSAIILIKSSSYGKTSPSENAKKIELFHEGVKLEVIDELENYYKIKSSEGIVVWVKRDDFMEI